MTNKKPSPRSIRLWISLALIVLAGFLLAWKGPVFFNGSSDPAFFRKLVYGFTGIGVLAFAWQIYKSKHNTILLAVLRPLLLAGLALGVTALTGNYLVGITGVTTDQNCEKLFTLADQLSQGNDLQGAESLLNQCLAQTKAPRYAQQAEIKLARIYVNEVSLFTSQGICRKSYFEERLSRAMGLASKNNQDDLVSLIQEKISGAEKICNETIATTPNPMVDQYDIDVLRTALRDGHGTLDLRVIKNHDQQVLDLTQDNFSLWDGAQ